MKTTSIEKICPCSFYDEKGKEVEYYRVLVRTTDENGGVTYTLEKACKEIRGLDELGLGYDCVCLYDRYGRICAVTT